MRQQWQRATDWQSAQAPACCRREGGREARRRGPGLGRPLAGARGRACLARAPPARLQLAEQWTSACRRPSGTRRQLASRVKHRHTPDQLASSRGTTRLRTLLWCRARAHEKLLSQLDLPARTEPTQTEQQRKRAENRTKI